MGYVFDHYALLYMLEQFPRSIATGPWALFEECCRDNTIISQREAQKSLDNDAVELSSLEWAKKNSGIFKPIGHSENNFLGIMMANKEFDFYENPRLAERRVPEAIPFILCMAKVQGRRYVYRKNTNTDVFNKITKICKSYEIDYIEVEECLLCLKKEHPSEP